MEGFTVLGRKRQEKSRKVWLIQKKDLSLHPTESATLPIEQRTRAGLLFSDDMNIYTKQPLSIADQKVKKLVAREFNLPQHALTLPLWASLKDGNKNRCGKLLFGECSIYPPLVP